MKSLLIACLFCLSLPAMAQNIPFGVYRYIGYIFDDNRLPLPNPDLNLTFEFTADGISKLKWFRNNEDGYCERWATYEVISEGLVKQKTYWVDPNNHSSCASDPDMKPNRETTTKFLLKDNELHFFFELNDKPFIYILSRVPTTD